MNKLNLLKTAGIILALVGSVLVVSEPAMAQVDFSKAEDVGEGFIASLRGKLATVILSLGFIITGYLASVNKISWGWVWGIVLAAFFIFAGPTIVDNLRAAFS